MTQLPGASLEPDYDEVPTAAAIALSMGVVDPLLGARLQAVLEAEPPQPQAPEGPAPIAPAATASALPWPVYLAGPPPPPGTLPSTQRPCQAPQQAGNNEAGPPGGSL